jgi:hypothetical protein
MFVGFNSAKVSTIFETSKHFVKKVYPQIKQASANLRKMSEKLSFRS